MTAVRRTLPLLAALSFACASQIDPGNSSQDNVIYSSRVHKMPRLDSSVTNTTAPAGAHLTYYGGRVISNVRVVQVLWGSGSYLGNVSSTSTPSMATFYQQVTNSAYFDWLNEYNTPASGGTNQTIGRGSFSAQFTITPSTSSSTIDDTAIQSELNSQIAAGHLPAPTTDSAGNVNTYYAIFFPPGKTITQGGSSSCVAGGFCAYHGTFTRNSQHLYYGVHPDMQAGSGCDTGCGNGTVFGNYTSVASHELVEATTDAEVGLATVLGPPLAWYDNTNGEIGDICNAQQGSITGGDGVSYTVQKEFSNVANDCIVSRAVVGNDFSVSASPASLSVQQGGSGSSTISTATTSGSAQTVALSVSGAPSGVTASLSPASVSSGQSSTLSISVSASAAAGTYTLTVKGTATSGSHTATVALTVTSAGGGGGGAIVNGDFEQGSLAGWTASGASETAVSSGCHSGTWCAQLGSTSPTSGDSSIAQTFTAPSNATGLSFYYKETCPDTLTYDWAVVTLKDNTTGASTTPVARKCATTAWTQGTATLTAGHSYTLTLTSHDDNYSGDATYTLYDDVTVTTGSPPPPPPSGITNGGFETGSLSGWTASGASETVVSPGRTGNFAAQLGATSPTNGDSSISQTFTVPSGKSQLSVWYMMTCPDTLTYDWATATLKNNATGATNTFLPRTCATNSSWVNVTAFVSAGTSYTLTLTSHDDDYSVDPSYTFFDDVTLN